MKEVRVVELEAEVKAQKDATTLQLSLPREITQIGISYVRLTNNQISQMRLSG